MAGGAAVLSEAPTGTKWIHVLQEFTLILIVLLNIEVCLEWLSSQFAELKMDCTNIREWNDKFEIYSFIKYAVFRVFC